MNSEQIIAAMLAKLAADNVTLQQFVHFDIEESWEEELKAIVGPWHEVERKRIHPDEYQFVVKFELHDIYIAFDGSYSSWSGTDFSDTMPYEVVKSSKTVEYWKAV